ncbi:MAG: DUF2029 domain-containing protein [Chloroflexota bacterium]|nr:DUF2029 domain-containing protein [Chloroflexota bacterium]
MRAPARIGHLDDAFRFFARSRILQAAVVAVFLSGWIVQAVTSYLSPDLGGLFRWIGIDFGFYLAQAGVFAHHELAGLYSIDAATPFREGLAAYSTQPGLPTPAGPVPYPPLFAWLVSPLAGLSPPLAFAFWTVVNASLALILAWRVSSFFPPERRFLAAGVLLVSSALVFSLWFGQVQLLLSVAFGEAFVRLRQGRDLRAGIWLAIIVVKPQYLLLILPILLWKRRWLALAGFAIGGIAILGASVLVAGLGSIPAYVGSLVESVSASSGAILSSVAPDVMVNWRALVLSVPLNLPDTVRLAITLILSATTVAAVIVAFRGPWQPTEPRFAGQMTLLGIGTILAAYHSHIHGVTMIAVPLAAFLAFRVARTAADQAILRAISITLAAAIVAPWLWFAVLSRSHTRANTMVAVALVVGFVLLFVYLRRLEAKPSPSDESTTVTREARPARSTSDIRNGAIPGCSPAQPEPAIQAPVSPATSHARSV